MTSHASGDLNSLTELSAWRSPSVSVMRVILLHLYISCAWCVILCGWIIQFWRDSFFHIDHKEIRRQCLLVDCAADAARVTSLYVVVLWRHVFGPPQNADSQVEWCASICLDRLPILRMSTGRREQLSARTWLCLRSACVVHQPNVCQSPVFKKKTELWIWHRQALALHVLSIAGALEARKLQCLLFCTSQEHLSVAPILSRLMEKSLVKQLLYPVFIHPHCSHLFSDQFGFRPTGSTTAALVYLLHQISQLLYKIIVMCM